MSEQPSLLFCCFDVVPGPFALSRRLTQYLQGLSEQFQVVVLSNKTPEHPHIEKYLGARLLRVPIGSTDLPTQVQAFDRAVKRQLESEEYLAVHAFDPFGGYPVCEAKEELGFKVVYDATSFPSFDLPGRVPAIADDRRFLARARRQELYCLMNSEAVIVGSQLTRQWVGSLGVDPSQVHLIHAPVDLGPYTPDVMGQPDATPMKIVHLGGLQDWHDLPTLLEAMSLALQTCDVRLAIVGPRLPELLAPLEERVRALELTGKVEFQEPVAHDDVHKILATADLGALTLTDCERNRAVGAPLARLGEYLAAGRPVVAANLPVARELVPEGAGAFYEPGSARALADALVALANDPKQRVTMGAAARAGAAAFDAVTGRKELLALYAQVTGLKELVAPAPVAEVGPTESTQVGFVPPGLGASVIGEEREGTDPANARVPAMMAALAEGVTDPHANREAAPVMGTLVRETTSERADAPEPTPISGQRAIDELARPTDPAASQGKSEPVVVGTLVRETKSERAAAPEPTPISGQRAIDELARPTDPASVGKSAPVVMGTPVRDEGAAAALKPEHTPPEPMPAVSPAAPSVERTPAEPNPAYVPAAPEHTPPEPLPAFSPAAAVASPAPILEHTPPEPLPPYVPAPSQAGGPASTLEELTTGQAVSPADAPAIPATTPEAARTMADASPASQLAAPAPVSVSVAAPSASSAVLSFLPPLDAAALARGGGSLFDAQSTATSQGVPATANPDAQRGASSGPPPPASASALVGAPASSVGAARVAGGERELPIVSGALPAAGAAGELRASPVLIAGTLETPAGSVGAAPVAGAESELPIVSGALPATGAAGELRAPPVLIAGTRETPTPPLLSPQGGPPLTSATAPPAAASPATTPAVTSTPSGSPPRAMPPIVAGTLRSPAAPSAAQPPVLSPVTSSPSAGAAPLRSPPRGVTAVPAPLHGPESARRSASEPPIVSGVMAPPGAGATLKLELPPGGLPYAAPPAAPGSAPTLRLGGSPTLPAPAGASPTIRLELPPGGNPFARPSAREPGIIAGIPLEAPPVLRRVDEAPGAASLHNSTRPTVGLAPSAPIGVGSGAPSAASQPVVNVGFASAPPSPMQPKSSASTVEEPEEISSDEVVEVASTAEPDEVLNADELQAEEIAAAAALPESALDPWHAQLVHGYCPPESNLFNRHTPPTTMPGRDH